MRRDVPLKSATVNFRQSVICEKQIEVIKNDNGSGSQSVRIMVRGLVQPFSLKLYKRTNAANVERMVCLVKAMYLESSNAVKAVTLVSLLSRPPKVSDRSTATPDHPIIQISESAQSQTNAKYCNIDGESASIERSIIRAIDLSTINPCNVGTHNDPRCRCQ